MCVCCIFLCVSIIFNFFSKWNYTLLYLLHLYTFLYLIIYLFLTLSWDILPKSNECRKGVKLDSMTISFDITWEFLIKLSEREINIWIKTVVTAFYSIMRTVTLVVNIICFTKTSFILSHQIILYLLLYLTITAVKSIYILFNCLFYYIDELFYKY